MRKKRAVALTLVGCFTVLLATAVEQAGARKFFHFRILKFAAHLSGDNEVLPVSTDAQGQFKAHISKDALEYELSVANINNVFAAHIHCAPPGENGPIGVTLYAGAQVTLNGVLAHGPILMPDLANSCGWDDLEDLIEAMRDGDTYVNVHTDGIPSGEIRGNIDGIFFW